MEDILQVLLEFFQSGNSFLGGFQNLLLVDKHLPSTTLHQRAKALAHSKTNIAQNLKAVRARHEKCKAPVAKDSDGLRKTLKCLKFEASEIELLKLLGRIHGGIYNLKFKSKRSEATLDCPTMQQTAHAEKLQIVDFKL